jgi:hypothetical protein
VLELEAEASKLRDIRKEHFATDGVDVGRRTVTHAGRNC